MSKCYVICCLIVAIFVSSTIALPPVQTEPDFPSEHHDVDHSLSGRLHAEDALENALQEDQSAQAEVQAAARKGRSFRSSFRSSKYSKYSKFKVYKIGGTRYSGPYLGHRRANPWRSHYYIYGLDGYPYGYHRYGYGRPKYKPGELWCNTWTRGQCTGNSMSMKEDKSGSHLSSKEQCIFYCNSHKAGCCRYQAGKECTAHTGSGIQKIGADEVCNERQARHYAKPDKNRGRMPTKDDLPRPASNQSVVMFVLKDKQDVKKIYSKIGAFLWTKPTFVDAKERILKCGKAACASVHTSATCACSNATLAACPDACLKKELSMYTEEAPINRTVSSTEETEELQTELAASNAPTVAPTANEPLAKAMQNLTDGERMAWVGIAGKTHDESAAALTDALNNNKIDGAHKAIALDGEDDNEEDSKNGVWTALGVVVGLGAFFGGLFIVTKVFG